MSSPSSPDPRFEQAVISDSAMLEAHEHALVDKVDDGGVYKLLPLVLLFTFSSLIFFGGTYLNRFSGHFSSEVFDERAKAPTGPAEVVKLDPVVYGKKQFDSLCITCHQPTGLGIPGVYPPLAGSEWVNGSEDRIIRILLNGLKGPITVHGATFGAVPMPVIGPGGQGWNDEKIAAVLTYVRQEWGNKAPAVTTEKVTEIRGKVGTRVEWSAEELLKVP
jgi:mono/diheme cytochrome c family protein